MQGNWFHDAAVYRCRYPREYAVANSLEHPTNVFLKENLLIAPIDEWLAEISAAERIEHTLIQLEADQPDPVAATQPLRQAIAECDQKLARHRAALEAGADPAMVAGWSSEIYRDRAILVAQLGATTNHAPAQRMNRDEIQQIVNALGGLLAVLRAAEPGDKLEVYRELGLKLTYDHENSVVTAGLNPQPSVGVLTVSGGRLAHYAHQLSQRISITIG